MVMDMAMDERTAMDDNGDWWQWTAMEMDGNCGQQWRWMATDDDGDGRQWTMMEMDGNGNGNG